MKKDTRQWVILTMDEIFEYTTPNNEPFVKPTFPTRRWGKTYTKTSTDNIVAINLILTKYKDNGFTVRKRIDYETMKRFHPSYGKFYYIQIKK